MSQFILILFQKLRNAIHSTLLLMFRPRDFKSYVEPKRGLDDSSIFLDSHSGIVGF